MPTPRHYPPQYQPLCTFLRRLKIKNPCTLVVVPNLTINGDLIERVTLFFVGKMFVLKDCLKSKFSVRYGDIEWGGQVSAAWYVHLTDSSEETIANWLKSMGWNVILIDERDDDDE